MKYFFVLGSNPNLSIAEITAVLGCEKIEYMPTGGVCIVDGADIEKEIINRLGGVIKFGIIKDKINLQNIESLLPNEYQGKFLFGISYYGDRKFKEKQIAMEIKQKLKERSISSRWVTSKEQTLSSVVVEQNKLVDKGLEIVVIQNGDTTFVGKTLAVQPFKELSHRDYGRPSRDDRSGMLPPKLAMIMINLAQPDKKEILLDPFCGSGTVVTEALCMGLNSVVGSDISAKAIADSKKNVNWIKTQYPSVKGTYDLKQIDAKELSRNFKPNSIGAIVTETYLGPQRGKFDIQKTKRELESLYSQVFVEMYKILKTGGRLVIALPVFKTGQGDIMLNINTVGRFKKISTIPQPLTKEVMQTELIYGRTGQKVMRQILVLEK